MGTGNDYVVQSQTPWLVRMPVHRTKARGVSYLYAPDELLTHGTTPDTGDYPSMNRRPTSSTLHPHSAQPLGLRSPLTPRGATSHRLVHHS